MAKLQELEKYLSHEFSTGCYTGEDYKTFQRKYINYLRTLCRERGWEVCNPIKGHYHFSVFIRNKQNHHVYLSIQDVRFWKNEWYEHILIRTATSEKDYHGDGNNYIDLPQLPRMLKILFGRF